MSRLKRKIQVNIPLRMLFDTHLSLFIENEINPEIGFDGDILDNCPLSRCSGVAEQLRDRGLTITLHAPFMDLSPGSPDPGIRAFTRRRFEQVLRLAGLFRPLRVVCHAGYDSRRYRYLRDVWTENSLDTFAWLGSRMRDEGTSLALENVYESGPGEMAELFKGLQGAGVGFCLDTGHQNAFGQEPLATWVEDLSPFLEQLHLHDNDGTEDSHLPLGRGTIDFRSFFRALRSVKEKAPVVTLEPHREEDLLPSMEYLEEVWPW